MKAKLADAYRQIYGQMDGQIDGYIDEQIDVNKDEQIDRQIQFYRQINRYKRRILEKQNIIKAKLADTYRQIDTKIDIYKFIDRQIN